MFTSKRVWSLLRGLMSVTAVVSGGCVGPFSRSWPRTFCAPAFQDALRSPVVWLGYGRDSTPTPRHDAAQKTLGWAPGQLLLDAGTFYAVTQASDTALTGRWIDGSYLLSPVRHGDVVTAEHLQGFFCARKISTP